MQSKKKMTFCTTTVFAAVVNAMAAAAVIGAVVSMALDGTDVAVPVMMPPPPPPPTPPTGRRDYDEILQYAMRTPEITCSEVSGSAYCDKQTPSWMLYVCADSCNFDYVHDTTADSDILAALFYSGGSCDGVIADECKTEEVFYSNDLDGRARNHFACPFSCPWPIVAPSPPSPPPLVQRDYDDYFEYYRYGQYTGTQTCSNNNNLGDYTSQCNAYNIESYMCAATCNFDYVHDATADSDAVAVAAYLGHTTCADSKLEGQPCATEDLYYQETIRQRAKYQFACPVSCPWDIENAAA